MKNYKNKKAWGWLATSLLLLGAAYLTINYKLLVIGMIYRWAAFDYSNAIINTISFGIQALLLLITITTLSRKLLSALLIIIFISSATNIIYQKILGNALDAASLQWLLGESRQFAPALKEFHQPFLIGTIRAGIGIALLLAARHFFQLWIRARDSKTTQPQHKIWLITITSFILLDPALAFVGRPRAAEMNTYGMMVRLLFEELPERKQVTANLETNPATNKILWIVDESVSWQQFDKLFRSNWASNWNAIDFGKARSSANCSAQSNAALRWGLNIDRINPNSDLRTNSTIWAYARKADFRTTLIDGQVKGNPQNYLWANERSLIDNIISAESGFETDIKIAKFLNNIIKSPGRDFVYAVLKGSHYQYYSNYPGGDADKNLTITEQYVNSLNYSKLNFMETILEGVDLNDTMIIYTSDHGQHIETGKIPHCNTNPHIDELSVPLLLLTGDKLHKEFTQSTEGTKSHSQIFPTTLVLMGYNQEYATSSYDNPLPQPTKKIIRLGKRIFPGPSKNPIELYFEN